MKCPVCMFPTAIVMAAIVAGFCEGSEMLSGCKVSSRDDLTNRVTKKSLLHSVETLLRQSENLKERLKEGKGECITLSFTNFDIDLDKLRGYADVAIRNARIVSDMYNSKSDSFLEASGWPGNITDLMADNNCARGGNPFSGGQPILASLTLSALSANVAMFAAGSCQAPSDTDEKAECFYRYRNLSRTENNFMLNTGRFGVLEEEWFATPHRFVEEINAKLSAGRELSNASLPVTAAVRDVGSRSVRDFSIAYSPLLWTDPYYDCVLGFIWMITYSAPIIRTRDDGQLEFVGMAAIDINLSDLDLNECGNVSSGESDDAGGASSASLAFDKFRNTHLCEPATTECRPLAGLGFNFGSYRCQCKKGFYRRGNTGGSLPGEEQYFNGVDIEDATDMVRSTSACGCSARQACMSTTEEIRRILDEQFSCVPCPEGCTECTSGEEVCTLQSSAGLVAFLTTLNIIAIILCAALIVFVVLSRHSHSFRAASWPFLVIMLLGAILALLGVSMPAFSGGFSALRPSNLQCALAPWCYFMGFALTYGSVLVKTWRLYQIFSGRRFRGRSREVLSNADLALMLLGIAAVFFVLLSFWTGGLPSYVQHSRTSAASLQYSYCSTSFVDNVMLIVTLLVVLPAVYYSSQLRNLVDEFSETKEIFVSVYAFLAVQILFLVVRNVFTLLPDMRYLLDTLDVHFSFSLLVGVFFLPKVLRLVRGGQSGSPSRRHTATATRVNTFRRKTITQVQDEGADEVDETK
eukprot:scpid53080/ scgid34383/ Probable G-protein coupled receptor 158